MFRPPFHAFALVLLAVLGTLVLPACDPCRSLAKSPTIADKDSAAFCYYDRKQYETAGLLFEELLPFYSPTPRGENIFFMLAECKMRNGELLTAAYQFQEFTTRYPNSSLAEDATYYLAYCYYLQSNAVELDQTDTEKAIQYMQFFLKVYPGTDRKAKVEAYLQEMRDKLAQKALRQANQYYKLGYYQAAVVAYGNLLRDFPDASFRQQVMLNRFKASVTLAEKSVAERRDERWLAAKKYYLNFVDAFSDSPLLREAERLYGRVETQARLAEERSAQQP